ncbi:MAG: lysylphosphatidylglycerol synthase transmembrane domain-containing protein [Candidatus Krumholzibacteria bacterium]|nr:lysylphosphatidylglycerol synthase transmembrane domain-containing protein [Candidatus Krumholzibacteria bacterium]
MSNGRILFTSAHAISYYSKIRRLGGCMGYQITKKRIRRGLQIFIVLSMSSLIAIFLLTHSHMSVEAMRNVQPLWLLCAVPFIFMDWFAGGFRILIFSRVFHPQIRFKTCFKANLANYFLGSITPAQTGGGPAQIWMLYAGGMPPVEATSASLMVFFSTTFFLIVAGGAIYAFKGIVPMSGKLMHHLFNVGMLFFLIVAALMVIAVVVPGFYRELTKIVVLIVSRVRRKDYLRTGSWASGMIDAIDRCHRQLIHYLQKHFHIFLLGILLSGLCFLSKFTVAYFIVRSLGMHASFVEVMLLQMAITLINYFFPTPGGSGAAELSSAALMSAVVSKGLIGFYVILWRLLTTYAAVAVGGGVVLHELGKQDRVEIDDAISEDVPEPEVTTAP